MVISGIDTNDISVVVQGAVDKYITPLCLASIREHLPEAEIILSTWEGTNVEGLDYDQVLLNEDPGGFDHNNVEYSVKNNYDRQIYSSIQGLRISERKYSVKMRTDFVIKSPGFLAWFDKFPARNDKYSFFKHKIICCENYSRNPRYSHMEHRYALHPADFFFFGLTVDLKDLFDIPLSSEEERIYFSQKYRDKYCFTLAKFVPEQFLWVGYLKKQTICQKLIPEDREDLSKNAIRLTERTFAANLIILSNNQIGIECAKLGVYLANPVNCYSHFDWLCLYSRYCKNRWGLYSIFLLKTFCRNEWAGIKRLPVNIGRAWIKTLKVFVQNRIYPRLSREQKAVLKPLYQKLKPVYVRLVRKFEITGQDNKYAESYFNSPVAACDVSVVIQGAVSNATKACIDSVRKVLPGAEVILSTWEGTDVTGLDCDKVIFNRDPGPSGLIRLYPHKQINNVNRQLVSSLTGVRSASRQYCMKIRSDMLLTSDAFLTYYNRYAHYLAPDAPVGRRIMVEGLMTNRGILFDISDWWYLGLKRDMEKLFDAPLYPVESTPYFLQPDQKEKKPPGADLLCRYIPEQYISYSFFKRCVTAPYAKCATFSHAYDNTPENVDAYNRYLSGAFLCLECAESGVILPKAINVICPPTYDNYSFANWQELCLKYGTLPMRSYERKLQEEQIRQIKLYAMAPRYFDVENYSNIIQNYAKFTSEGEFTPSDIEKSDITFVVSGKIQVRGEQNTHRCLESIRRFFPQSKIVLSTWRGEPIDGLSGLYDTSVLLDEPKDKRVTYFMPGHSDKRLNSVNLQQLSVHAGLSKVKTRFAVRLRTDFYLINDNLLSFYREWSNELRKTDENYRLFEERVLVTQLFTYDVRLGGYAYALADSFQFGRTGDLLKLWDGHQESLRSFNFFAEHPHSSWENPKQFNHRYRAEQYFLMNLIQKEGLKLKLPKWYFDHSSEDFIFETEKVHSSNLLIGDFQQLGMVSTLVDEANHPICLTHERLLELYLYNIEPGNKACLAYLKEQYTVPPAPKKPIMRTIVSLPGKAVVGCIRAVGRGAKRIMRIVLPAYRVGTGTRDRLIVFESAEYDRFNYLVYQLNELTKVQNAQAEELKKLKALAYSEETEDALDEGAEDE